MPEIPEPSNQAQSSSPRQDPILHQPPLGSWSLTLEKQTREALKEIQFSPHTGKLHLKNNDGRYGYITTIDLISNQLIVKDASSGPSIKFETADELIADGWAID
jgi:hypothetical protein